MNSGTTEIGDLVLTALEMALEHEGECRLLTVGRRKGLLPGGKLTAAKKQAKDQCLDPELALFTVREASEGEGASASNMPFVTITRTGIELLFERRPAAERRKLLDKCANPHKETAHDALLRVTEQELKQIASQRKSLDERTAELRQFFKKFLEDQLTELDEVRTELDRQQRELQELNEPTRPDRMTDSEPSIRPPQPVTEGDIDFQQRLCRELVFAWQDNPEPEARAALEVAMGNAGLERVGEVGETVLFDNRDHRTDSDLMPGQPAVVVEPGWQLVSPRGTLLIAPAQVSAAPKIEGTSHASHAEH